MTNAELQRALLTLDFDLGAVDGRIGKQMTDAVPALLKAYGLLVDSRPSPQTRQR